MRYKYSEEDIKFLKENYPIGNWEAIFKRFPFHSRHAIKTKMKKLGIPTNPLNSRNNINSVLNPDVTNEWSIEEKEIFINNCRKCSIDAMCFLLPNKSRTAIALKYEETGISPPRLVFNHWEDSELDYILEHWVLMPDKVIAQNLNRTFRAVKAKREELGLYRQDMDSNTYPTISKYLRGQNQAWKIASMKSCDYKCVLTGSKDFQIHHLYGVSNIISDVLKECPDLDKESISDYTDEELSFLLQIFLKKQSEYPLGECIDKKLHVLFHSLYGQYYNTPEQWYQFKMDYKNGIYNNI